MKLCNAMRVSVISICRTISCLGANNNSNILKRSGYTAMSINPLFATYLKVMEHFISIVNGQRSDSISLWACRKNYGMVGYYFQRKTKKSLDNVEGIILILNLRL